MRPAPWIRYVRSDIDGQPVPALPSAWAAMANQIASEAGMTLAADLCIVNWYSAHSRSDLELHAGRR